MYLYCTASSGQLKFGPVHEMNWRVQCPVSNKIGVGQVKFG